VPGRYLWCASAIARGVRAAVYGVLSQVRRVYGDRPPVQRDAATQRPLSANGVHHRLQSGPLLATPRAGAAAAPPVTVVDTELLERCTLSWLHSLGVLPVSLDPTPSVLSDILPLVAEGSLLADTVEAVTGERVLGIQRGLVCFFFFFKI
jgi:hypothetical protein